MSVEKHLKEVAARVNGTVSTAPAHRLAFKKGYTFSKKSFEEQLAIWDYIWENAGSFWVRVHAFFFLEKYIGKKDLHKQIWKTSVRWQNEVYDWGLCDCLAKIYTKILETQPDAVYKQLQKWNKSGDLWKRRQSVVSLLYYTRTKKVILPFREIMLLIKPVLVDPEYYVQKGVGWALREIHTAYPVETHNWFKKHIHDISAIAFTAAMEKMEKEDKEKLKDMRKERRIILRGS